ncbi:MAG: carbohydrate ABC transporter substrate-binding protein [Lachnospiraceae bacterium]|nr:carbohydrate ABC transporter substrate-binding protein [Lachnospiraceae bacterium]
MKKRLRQLTACLLLGAMICLQGCGGKEKEPTGSVSPEEQTETPKAGEEETGDGGERSMGRYLEAEVTLPEDVSMSSYPTLCLQRLDSGELMLIEQTAGVYVSSDDGLSWSMKEAPWLRELREAYIAHMAIAPDGSVALVYSPPSDDSEASDGGYHPVCLYVDPEGNASDIASPDGNNEIFQLWFGKDSRLYAFLMSGKIYEMSPDGSSKEQLMEMEGISDYVCFTDSSMIISGSRGLTFYDMERRMPGDNDKVLQDFFTENAGDVGANSGSYTVVLAEGEQPDVIYFACESGLYRHVIGGTAVEQIMEGNLSSLGDPKMSLAGMVVLPDNEFLILYTNGKLYRYVYNPDIPTIPEEQVSIYSLTENYAVRQAVSLYQKQHPETYVRYEIGLNTGSGMTSEDAIKNLNTRLMSGSGPDLLVLDGLPRYSYEEKGVLTDLSGLAGEFSGEDALFPNIVEACKEDGKLWYLPLRFRLPLLVGDQGAIRKITDLTAFADAVEALREASPEGGLTGLLTEDKTLRTLGINCSGTWMDPKSGSIDKERLAEFLTQAKRIYQAEIKGVSEEELTEYTMHYENSLNWNGAMEYFASADTGAISVAMGEQKIGAGITSMVDGDFNAIATLAGQEENFGYEVWQGQIKNGFIPKGMIGICAGSKDSELAKDFFRFLYGRELQDSEVSTGLPVNMASFEHLKENPRPVDQGISIGSSGPDGIGFSLDIKWVGEEDFQKLRGMAESADAVCAGDAVIEEVVYDIGQKALNGSAGVEDTVEEIVKKAAIYLAE